MTSEVFIPNHEIQEEFTTATKISNWDEIVKSITLSDKLLKATLEFENETVANSRPVTFKFFAHYCSYY